MNLVRTSTIGAMTKSLADVMRERRRFLLLDCSGSMDSPVSGSYGGESTRKIDALRSLVSTLRNDHKLEFKQIVFGSEISIREDIPDPSGGTPLAAALRLAKEHNAMHIVVISDGEPDNRDEAMIAAHDLAPCKIDVFYIGPPGSTGEAFLKELALQNGGKFKTSSMSRDEIGALTGEVERALLALPPAIAL